MMPRIDPLQLLKCLAVLLAPDGGIKSKDEVSRIASLMTKFSKKLVSKCVYIHILKNTNTELIGMFMNEGGWGLTNSWLADAIEARNWPLMQELLELLLMCPVDVERLKLNNCPKLVKGLSKDPTNQNVQMLATQLVEQWLQIVKGANAIQPVEVAHYAQPTPAQDCVVQDESFLNHSTYTNICEVDTSVLGQGNYLTDTTFNSNIGLNSTFSGVTEDTCAKSEVDSVHLDYGSAVAISDINSEPIEAKVKVEPNLENGDTSEKLVLKFSIKDNKQVVLKSPTKRPLNIEDEKDSTPPKKKIKEENEDRKVKSEGVKDKEKRKHEKTRDEKRDRSDRDKRTSDKKSSRDALKSDSKSKSLGSDKKHHYSDKNDKVKDKVSSSSNKDKSRSSLSKDKDRERNKEKLKEKEKDKSKSEIQAEKDRATLATLMQPSVGKLGKIPKKSDSSKTSDKGSSKLVNPAVPVESKKISMSIEVRKTPGERPKTVKTFNSKFRSTGLEEAVRPPPPRTHKKSPPGTVNPAEKKDVSLLRTPSAKEMSPPDKRSKPNVNVAGPPERPGAIKLISPKPKPQVLQDSDFFMDALTAANVKREPRKRKRRTSGSKDDVAPATGGESSPTSSPDHNSADPTPPPVEKPVFKFYQETLQLNDDKEDHKKGNDNEASDDTAEKEVEDEKMETQDGERTPTPPSDEQEGSEDQDSQGEQDRAQRAEQEKNRIPRGVLVYHRSNKGPKKSIRWRPDSEIESVHYFELDETERVNVTKTFTDMKQEERMNEREAFHSSRRSSGEDQMEERITWMPLIPVDIPKTESPPIVPGKDSREREIQYAREKSIPPAPFYPKHLIPDSPAEPDPEIHAVTDPVVIALDDVTGPGTVNDYTSTPWPEPKPLLIPQSPPHSHTISHQHTSGPMMISPGMSGGWGHGNHIGGMVSNAGGDWRMDMGINMHSMGINMPVPMDISSGNDFSGYSPLPSADGMVVMPDPMSDHVMGPMNHGMGPGMPMGHGPMDMYGSGMPDNRGNPEMNFNLRQDMWQNNMMQGGYDGPPMNYEFGNQGPMGPSGQGNFRGRGRNWFRGGDSSWRGSRGRGSWSGPGGKPRPICRYFKKGNCATPNCTFLHPADLKVGRGAH